MTQNRPTPGRRALKIASGFRFGDWEVLPRENLLRRGAHRLHLEPKVMKLLVLLAGRLEEPWAKHELMDELWPSVHSGESSLTRAVSELRRALGDKRTNARYIDTIQNVGYKAIAPVRPLHVSTVAGAEELRRETDNRDGAAESLDMAGYLVARRNCADCRTALELLTEADRRQPGHAAVQAMIAQSERLIHQYCNQPARLHLQRARAAAEQALSLDQGEALAWSVMAALDHDQWNWTTALRRFRHAVELNRESAMIQHDYAELLWNLGRIDEAAAAIRRCCALNPVGAGERLIHGWILLHSDTEHAWQQLGMARQLGSDAVFVDNLECCLFNRQGWNEAGIGRWQELHARRRDDPLWMWHQALVERVTSGHSGSRVAELVRNRVLEHSLNSGVAVFILTVAGLVDEAHDMAGTALEDRSLFVVDPWLPEMQSFREDERFVSLMHACGLDASLCPRLEES